MEAIEQINNVADLNLDLFLARNKIEKSQWDSASIDWGTLQAIGVDHQSRRTQLEGSAQLLANTIQSFEKVHSVRWRIKDPEHLMKKIVRKKSEHLEKYKNIDADNYFDIVADLVGIRALHLFKEDCFSIDAPVRSTWEISEGPIAYLRTGDPDELKERLTEAKFEVKTHPAGYRSIHYVISSQPLKRRLLAELQVRTIFEEGWSEIDHTVRYPDFSDDKLIAYFLRIFNRLAGSADEMGSFVQDLVLKIEEHASAKIAWEKEKRESSTQIDRLLVELESAQDKKENAVNTISQLKEEINKLKNSSRVPIGLLNFDTERHGALSAFLESENYKNAVEQMNKAGILSSLESFGKRPKK